MQQASCKALDVGDLDGDGKADHADMTASVRVLPMGETAQAAGFFFTNVAHAQTTAHLTVTGTSRGTLVIDASQDDWYAMGVGRVTSLLKITVEGVGSETTTISLQSYTQPPVATAIQSAETALIAPEATAPPRPSLEAAALTLARRSLLVSP